MKKFDSFSELPISGEVLTAIADMGFEKPSPIQSETIFPILEGKDIIGQAQTGTGKTAAFGIPLIEMLEKGSSNTRAIILCPTRELAVQVCGELKKIAKYKTWIKITSVYGGAPITKQIQDLKSGMHIVVGTPGRVIDHLERKTLKLEEVDYLILDEADEMLNMGFREDIEFIMEHCPEDSQKILFSATMPKPIQDIAERFQQNPVKIQIAAGEVTAKSIEQSCFEVHYKDKPETIVQVHAAYGIRQSLVFCNTKKRVDETVETLQSLGLRAEGLHGDMNQNRRNSVLGAFRHGQVNVLVATDVAARGIDVKDVDAVFNYDLPMEIESYVHRIGRTGRAGRNGLAFSFLSAREDLRRLRDIERHTGVALIRKELPTVKEIMKFKAEQLMGRIAATLQAENLAPYEKMVEAALSQWDAETLLKALFRIELGAFPEEKKEFKKFKIQDERGGGEGFNRRGGSGGKGRFDRPFNRDRNGSGSGEKRERRDFGNGGGGYGEKREFKSGNSEGRYGRGDKRPRFGK
ncbi:MAG: DEAD/DEAH box helicase [Cytophagaceae bacterium]|jgi:ATP-dependent RNA helicase DeaD|nr:DEAD/DEAH box helicase [Cytophagaceae bacterium]